MSKRTKWLSRQAAMPLPCMTLCLSDKEFKRVCRELRAGETEFIAYGSDGMTHFLRDNEGDSVAVVCISGTDRLNAVEVAGLIVHEAVHVWQHYCMMIHEHEPASEQEAYGIQSISKSLMAEYARRIG